MSTAIGTPQVRHRFPLAPQDHAAGVFWVGILLGLSPFLFKYCRTMWYQELYQYFPFLLAGVFGLAYQRWDGRIRLLESLFSRVAMLVAMTLAASGAVLASSWLGAVSFVVAVAAFLSSQRESRTNTASPGAQGSSLNATAERRLSPAPGMSLFYLAIPMVMFVRAPLLGTYTVMFRLQRATTVLGSTLLDVLGVVHVRYGNTIELVNKSLFVAEACSGVQSLFTMCFLSLLLWAFRRRPFVTLPLFIAFAFFFALVGNVIRITTIAVSEAWFAIDLTHGPPHELVGYAALAIAAGMMASLDHIIGLLPSMTRRTSDVASDPGQRAGQIESAAEPSEFQFFGSFKALSRLCKLSVCVFMASGLAMVSSVLLRTRDVRPIVARDQVLFEPKATFFSEFDAPIKVVNHTSRRDAKADRNARHGMNSDGWQCGIPTGDGAPVQGQFLLSQPYMGWHELTVCYRNKDWCLAGRNPVTPSRGGEPVIVADFTASQTPARDRGRHGTLFFTAVESDGSIPRAPGSTTIARSLAPLEPLIFDDFAELTGSAQTIMLQYWVTSEQPLSEKDKQEVVNTLDSIRDYASKKVALYTRDLLEG